jgi:hypothetical protein
MAVDGDDELQMIPRSKEDAQRCTSSPRCFLGSRRSESQPEVTPTSPIPMSLLQRGTAKIHRLNELQSNSFNRVAYLFMAELRGLFSWHGRAYSGEVKFAGARVCGSDEKIFGEEEVRNLGFFPGGGTPFYSHRRSAAFIQDVEEVAVDRMPGEAPPSCLRPEEEDNEAKRYRGLGWAGVGLQPDGLRPGK